MPESILFKTLSLSIDEITNSHAKSTFHLKNLEQKHKTNFPLSKHIKEKYNFNTALQRQFIDKRTKNTYIKGLTKRQSITLKQTFVKSYNDIDDHIIRLLHQKSNFKNGYVKKLQRKK